MGRPTISYDDAKTTLDVVQRYLDDGYVLEGRPSAIYAAAKELGKDQSTVRNRVRMAAKRYQLLPSGGFDATSVVEMPNFPEEHIPIEDVIELRKKQFQIKKESFAAHTWFPVTIKSDAPVGICWFGDPHVDDDGCDWPQLDRDITICRETEGLYGANVGDSTNNWVGRLMKKYADQDTSVGTARRMAEWLMLDSGVTWLVWILGNHDTWNDGACILSEMAKRHGTNQLVLHDWECRFTLSFPNEWEPRIYTAHNFKGNSIWNIMHGPMREGQIGDEAELYVCGDRHTSGMFAWENPGRGLVQNFVRVRGYKFMDEYARRNGYKEQQQGCSAVTVFDPGSQAITSFLDIEEGAAYLKMKREQFNGSER